VIRGPTDLEMRLLRPEEWSELRALRLRALADAPEAFIAVGSDVARWSEQRWRSTFDTGSWAVARRRGRAVGMARSSREHQTPTTRHVESVWVEPRYRRCGVGKSLIEWLIRQELRDGAKEILIWVIGPNHAARRLYEGIGFSSTGELQVLGDGDRVEERLRLTEGPINLY
jgi:GNAT superfamily N-acetyltransferase